MRRIRRGVTLIELVVIIVLIGVMVPPLLMMFSDITKMSAQAELISTANALARSLLEEIISKNYDEKAYVSGCTSNCWSNPLGPDSGEARATYDDVDDFDGLNETSISGFPGFSRSATVYYVNPDLTAAEPPYHLDIVQPDSSNTLDYKRIDVTVSHSLVGSMKISTVISRSH